MADRITPVDWKTLVRVFEKDGFVKERVSSSHIVLIKSGIKRPVIIPKYPDIGRDIIMSNLRTAGMTRAQYLAYRKAIK